MDNNIDIKMLVVYKQHYREKYDVSLESQFSCIGYYDGMSVLDIGEFDSISGTTGSASAIPKIWHASQEISQMTNGRFSTQVVGMFRGKGSADSNREDIDITGFPYMAAVFLQIEKNDNEEETAKAVEEKYSETGEEISVAVTSYLTYDNASFICLCRSNSMARLSTKVNDICKYKGVRYSHSIFGINEEFLHQCAKSQNVLETFNGRNVNSDETIYNLSLRISHGESEDFDTKMMSLLVACNNMPGFMIKGIERARFYHKQGHINSVVVIPETDIRALITLLVDNGIGTHQNRMYEEKLYSIESSFTTIKGMEIPQELEGDYDWLNQPWDDNDYQSKFTSWTERQIIRYRGFAGECRDKKDDAAYAGYVGVMKSLNALSQYENYKIGRELFYIIYPSFSLFNKLVDDARAELKTEANRMASDAIKKQVNTYVSAVNAVLYHTVHSDQRYFMLPGYSGVSYAIPMKLLMFYHWFGQSLIQVLNDEEDYQYQVLISPMLEDVAQAIYLDFYTKKRDRLLFIKISRRAMSFPKNNLIVLCHEIGHYVGNSMRERRRRLLGICKAVGTLIAECTLAIRDTRMDEEPLSENVEQQINNMVERLRRKTAERCSVRLAEKLVKSRPEDKFYYNDIIKELYILSRRLMLEDGGEVWSRAIPSVMNEINELDEDEQRAFLSEYRRLIEDEKLNRSEVIAQGLLDDMVKFILAMFREVYADVTAITVLGCSMEEFRESFDVSEGQHIEDRDQDEQIRLRLSIAKMLFNKGRNEHDDCDNGHVGTKCVYRRMMATEIAGSYYRFGWLQNILFDYATSCHERLKGELEKNGNMVTRIRAAYSVLDKDDGEASLDVYHTVRDCNNEYRAEVKKLIDKER